MCFLVDRPETYRRCCWLCSFFSTGTLKLDISSPSDRLVNCMTPNLLQVSPSASVSPSFSSTICWVFIMLCHSQILFSDKTLSGGTCPANSRNFGVPITRSLHSVCELQVSCALGTLNEDYITYQLHASKAVPSHQQTFPTILCTFPLLLLLRFSLFVFRSTIPVISFLSFSQFQSLFYLLSQHLPRASPYLQSHRWRPTMSSSAWAVCK